MSRPTVTPVPLLDLRAQFAPLEAEIRQAVGELIDSQQFILGPPVEALESEVAAYTGSRHAVGCASGTDALILALAALEIGEGDEVVTTPFSFFSTASCAYRVGARPRFVDIDPTTYNLDPAALDAAIGPRTRAIVPVHLFGQCADMEAILEIAGRHGLRIVEDAAQALGAHHGDRAAGTLGDVGCYSFFPSKNLGAFGDGGMLVTDDDAIAERLRSLRVHGGRQMYRHDFVGWNSRLDALQAVVLRIKLPHLDTWSRGRAANAERYDRWFTEAGLVDAGRITLPARGAGRDHIFNQYTVRAQRRDELRAHLQAREIGQSVYYPVPLHLQPCFADLGYREGDFPIAEAACREVLALPVFPELTREQQRAVVDAIVEFYP